MTDLINNSINNFPPFEQHLLNDFQRNMSLSATPYADMAKQLKVSEETVLRSMQSLQDDGVISRVGPVFRPNRIGVSTLAAMSVPADKLEYTAGIINDFPEVNHNYERDHQYNLWFVVTSLSQEHLNIVLYEIEQHTRQKLMSLPMLDDYFIDLGFELTGNFEQANKNG